MGKSIDRNRATRMAIQERTRAEQLMGISDKAFAQNLIIRQQFGQFTQLVEMFIDEFIAVAEKAYKQADSGAVCCYCDTPSGEEHPETCPFSMAMMMKGAILDIDKSLNIERVEGNDSGIVVPEIVIP